MSVAKGLSAVRIPREWPSGVVGALAAGESTETDANEYSLTPAQIHSALAYAAPVAAHLPPAVPQAS